MTGAKAGAIRFVLVVVLVLVLDFGGESEDEGKCPCPSVVKYSFIGKVCWWVEFQEESRKAMGSFM
jgi:hypothetical protein